MRIRIGNTDFSALFSLIRIRIFPTRSNLFPSRTWEKKLDPDPDKRTRIRTKEPGSETLHLPERYYC